MVRWTETRDSYRVTRLPGAGIFTLLLLSAAGAVGTAGCLRDAFIVGAAMLGALSVLCCLQVFLIWSDAPWIEMPLHGGPVAWGRGGRQEGRTASGVSHFDVATAERPGYELVAVLDDGTSRTRMGSWHGASPGGFQALIAQLNAHLGAAQDADLRLPDLVKQRRHKVGQWAAKAIVIVIVLAVLGFLAAIAALSRAMDRLD